MAAAEGAHVMDVECGYCFEKGNQLVDPRQLPCHHVYCYPCLVGDFNTNRIVRCGRCREVFDVTLARLPSTTGRENNSQFCDVCTTKGSVDVLAVSYCVSCNRKMCNRHDEMHQDFLPKHSDVIKIEEYRTKAVKLEVRKCSKHEDKPIVAGCAVFHERLCVSCMDGSQQCINRTGHHAVALDNLVGLLQAKAEEIKVDARCKEDSLYKLLKYSTKVLTDHDMKTEEMVHLLHTTRDRQLSAIRSKYDNLERELLKKRNTSKQQIVDYMEREVGEKLTDLNTLLLLQEGRFKDGHAVDVVSSYAETSDEMRKLIDDQLPSITVQQSKLQQLPDLCRTIDVDMTSGVDIAIDIQRSMWGMPLPTFMKLTNTVEVGECYSVCSYQGNAYVGRKGDIAVINESDMSQQVFKSDLGYVECIHIHNGNMYVLVDKDGHWVCKYSLDGELITKWKHNTDRSYTKLARIDNRIVVPDVPTKSLQIYSLGGQLHKEVNFSQTGDWNRLALSAVDKESVIVSSEKSSSVLRVNINTEKVMWTSTHVNSPGGVTCYGEDFVLVASSGSERTEVSILDFRSGDHLGTLVDPTVIGKSNVFDLLLRGNTLMVPRNKKLLFYELS